MLQHALPDLYCLPLHHMLRIKDYTYPVLVQHNAYKDNEEVSHEPALPEEDAHKAL